MEQDSFHGLLSMTACKKRYGDHVMCEMIIDYTFSPRMACQSHSNQRNVTVYLFRTLSPALGNAVESSTPAMQRAFALVHDESMY